MATKRYPMSMREAVDHCDALDLPDGAYFAMIEELSGAEPGDLIALDEAQPVRPKKRGKRRRKKRGNE